MKYFLGFDDIDYRNLNENYQLPDKILINHYKLKSREEFANKNNGFVGDVAYSQKSYYDVKQFSHAENNKVSDDSILTYRDARKNFFEDKMETFLTCRALASYLKEKILDKKREHSLSRQRWRQFFKQFIQI